MGRRKETKREARWRRLREWLLSPQQMTNDEMATALGVSESTVRRDLEDPEFKVFVFGKTDPYLDAGIAEDAKNRAWAAWQEYVAVAFDRQHPKQYEALIGLLSKGGVDMTPKKKEDSDEQEYARLISEGEARRMKALGEGIMKGAVEVFRAGQNAALPEGIVEAESHTVEGEVSGERDAEQ